MPNLTREKRIHLAIWKKASIEGSVEVTMPTYPKALHLRMAMYRTIGPYRRNPEIDPTISDIAERFAIDCKPSPLGNNHPAVLTVKEKVSFGASIQAMELLGLTEADLLDASEIESQERMKQALGDLIDEGQGRPEYPPPPESSDIQLEAPNPFFKR